MDRDCKKCHYFEIRGQEFWCLIDCGSIPPSLAEYHPCKQFIKKQITILDIMKKQAKKRNG